MTYHEIGHLPFEVEITQFVTYNSSNLLTVVVDNTLLSDTVPQGSIRDIIVEWVIHYLCIYTDTSEEEEK